MTDLEITKLCAEAMGLTRATWAHNPKTFVTHCDDEGVDQVFDPLQDDAQAMALVKKLDMEIRNHAEGWRVDTDPFGTLVWAVGSDLNRAICECVAKMQAAKAAPHD